jgi:hypothetical protein
MGLTQVFGVNCHGLIGVKSHIANVDGLLVKSQQAEGVLQANEQNLL